MIIFLIMFVYCLVEYHVISNIERMAIMTKTSMRRLMICTKLKYKPGTLSNMS